MKDSRSGIIAVFGISEPEMTVNTSNIRYPYFGELRKDSSRRNIYAQSVLRPRKVSSLLNDLSSERIFHDRNKLSDGYPQRKGADLCLEWSNSANEYCQKTSLHGLKYVGDSELSLSERLIWLVTFILGVLAAAYFIMNLYNRWSDNPMIITLSSKATLLEAIPFPAVTICNMNGAKKSVADLVDLHRNDSEALFEKYMLKKLCKEETPQSKSQHKINASWNKMQNFMIKVSQPCHSMLVTCFWRSEPMLCQDLFNPEMTDEGMCCSFNKVKRNFIYRNPRQLHGMNYTFPYPGIDWTPEAGYPPDAAPNVNPWRAFGSGKGHGLSVILDAELFDYYCSSTASVGFKALLHSPVETPKVSEFAYFITPGEEMRVEITPKISTTTPSLMNIPQSKRRCVFTSERNLRFYRTYTQRNCELECQSNFTLEQCKCVPFYLPKDGTTRVCGTADDDCVELVKGNSKGIKVRAGKSPCTAAMTGCPGVLGFSPEIPVKAGIFPKLNIKKFKIFGILWWLVNDKWRAIFFVHSRKLDIVDKKSRPSDASGMEWEKPKEVNCSCLPSCVQIFYSKQTSTGRLDDMIKVDSSFLNGKEPAYYKKNMAVVHFFFVENSFTSFEKGEIFGFTDFLSSTGGLLGLFLGFSFMSAAEIAYFMTLKIFCSMRRNNRQDGEFSEKALPFVK